MKLYRNLFLLCAVLILVFVFFIKYKNKSGIQIPDETINYQESNIPPEISGWIAWWKEKDAYDLIQKYPDKFKSVSPVWFFINKDLELVEIGKVDRAKTVSELKNLNILILPSLGSELNEDEFSRFLNSPEKTGILIDKFVNELTSLGVEGADIDLEGIKKEDRDAFSSFLTKLSQKFKYKSLILVITVHAQTPKVEWEGVLGQDLKRIGGLADFVRIMAYDKNSCSTSAGAVSPMDWIQEVAIYNSGLIDKEKIVIGIPSYGYVWTKDNCKGLQFDEFNNFITGKNYSVSRDSKSYELVLKSDEFTGFLSDSQAMLEKIENLRKMGFNKFVIWSLGGMDEKFLGKNW